MKDDRSSEMATTRPLRQAPGDGWPDGWDDGPGAGTDGPLSGMDGEPMSLRARLRRADRRELAAGWLAIVLVAGLVMVVNALTVQSDMPWLTWWKPWVWEGSSILMLMLLIWLPWLTTAVAPPADVRGPGWHRRLRFAGIHLTAALVYSMLHVGGFLAMRRLVYRLLDVGPYLIGDLAGRFLYEFRKDLLTYGIFVAVFWLIGRLRRAREVPLRPVSFDIRDGGRIIRAPLDQIVAVTSAGNYVEFCLADGRRPLMRATLAAIEVELEGFGFVRAHRSWLVNVRKVTGLRPEGSGDWTVELGLLEAPLSRRYPRALERLRAPD